MLVTGNSAVKEIFIFLLIQIKRNMRKYLLFLASIILLSSPLRAQNISFTIDSTAFNAITLDGGLVQAKFADVNQDGHLDMLTIGDHGSPNINTNQHGICVFFGNGTGTGWSLFQNGNFGYGGIAIGDINNDGMQDVAYGMHHNYNSGDFGDQLMEAALGDGSGMNWTPWDDSLGLNGENYGMFGTDLGDFDNDGLLDIGGNSFGCCSGVHIYKNLGTGVWHQAMGCCYGNTGHYIQFGDINHDGNLDFVVSNEVGSPYFGDGAGNFVLHHQSNLPAATQSDYCYDVSLGDIDNDGDDDFAFSHNNGIYVFKWNDSQQQWDDFSTGLPPATTDFYFISRLVDMDMDGWLDLVIASYNTATIQIWKGNGTSWSLMQSHYLPNMGSVSDVAIDDVDHNGFPDILLWARFQITIFSSVNRIKLFREDSVAIDPRITATYPRNYECFPNNAVRFIHWVAAVPGNHASSVKIELSTSGTGGPWTVVDAAAPNNGTYQWTVPPAVSSANCYFRFTLTDSVTTATSVASNNFPFSIGTCSFPTGIQTLNSSNTLTAFPNPFSGNTEIFSSMKNCSLKIMDVTGKTVKEFSAVIKFPITIERGNMPSGIYFLELRSADGNIERTKLVVQ